MKESIKHMFSIRWLKCGLLLLIGGLYNLPTVVPIVEIGVVVVVVVGTLYGVK